MADLRLPADLAWVFLVSHVVDADHPLRRVTLKNYVTRLHGAAEVPVFVPRDGAETEAVDFRGLAPEEALRIARLLTILTGHDQPDPLVGTAPVVGEATAPVPADWTKHAGRILAEAMGELLAWHDRKPPARVARMLPMMRMRAWARLGARGEGPRDMGQPPTKARVQIDHHRHAYADFFAMHEYDLRFPRFDGSMSDTVTRGVFLSSDAALLLPYDPVRDRVLLVEQFRIGAAARGSANPWVLEPIAGLIDPGETAEETARREAREEAGLDLGALHVVCRAHPSPGAGTEFFHKFVGLADLPDDVTGQGGLDSEAEDIRSHLFPAEDFLARIDGDGFVAGPLVLMGLWLARHRARLRAEAGAA
ncbi:NUDIX domain-containing protein [Pseudaestuariivita atlantica]|uniref:NUDIX domain-containing protein n=1 Tax=Pseudaestuariivita atlantica TaxID=1317121 RepID=UPI00067DE0FC|nr:NUDIX domain-containing protein [Pseudaestuariivita atlantica]